MKTINKLFIFLLLGVLFSCGHLPDDPHPNPAASGYHRMEFDITNGSLFKKEIGIGNILLLENQTLDNVSFKFYGIYKGTIYLKSSACGINFSMPFEGEVLFNLKDLIPYPIKCSIKLTAETSKIEGKEHSIVETGEIKINVIPLGHKSLSFEYTRANSRTKAFYQVYSYTGQGSMQRQEGDLTYQETFTVKTGLTQGGSYRVSGCNTDVGDEKSTSDAVVISEEGTFTQSDFVVSFKKLYKKDYLSKTDSCDLEIMVIPNEIPETLEGRFSLSIYDSNAVVLENLDFSINKHWYDKKYDLKVSGMYYIAACSINGVSSISTQNKTSAVCTTKYDSNTTYWIRGVTSNGRKSVYALKDGNVVWKE